MAIFTITLAIVAIIIFLDCIKEIIKQAIPSIDCIVIWLLVIMWPVFLWAIYYLDPETTSSYEGGEWWMYVLCFIIPTFLYWGLVLVCKLICFPLKLVFQMFIPNKIKVNEEKELYKKIENNINNSNKIIEDVKKLKNKWKY